MRYKYLGKPDLMFPYLIKNHKYELLVETKKDRLIWIVSPFYCPYTTWEVFYKDWSPVKE